MGQISSTDPRRYLIAIGSPYCPRLGLPNLEHVENDIQQITSLFEKQGYERVLSDQIPIGSTAQVIKQSLIGWFASSDRRTSDYVVVYYGGHGDEGERFRQHYLFTVDSIESQLLITAIATQEFARIFFQGDKNTSPQNVLLILDTCYANAGGRQISKVLSELKDVAPEGSGFWLISSSNSSTESGDGTFVEALRTVMDAEYTGFQQSGEFISITDLVHHINQQFIATNQAQRAIGDARGFQQQAAFIRNPRFREQGQRPTQLAQAVECLWTLNCELQCQTFKNNTSRSRRAAAFVVQAKDARIQHWLVKRLFNQIPNVANARVFPFVIPAHPMWKNRDFSELWRDLAGKLQCLPNQTDVIDALVTTYRTKPIIIAMYGWLGTARSRTLQQQVLNELWQPLVEAVGALETQPLRSRIILFLAEGQESAASSALAESNLVVPIRLDPLAEITPDHIADWIESDYVFPVLSQLIPEERLGTLICEEIQEWSSDPVEAIEQICYIFNLENGIADIEAEWRLAG